MERPPGPGPVRIELIFGTDTTFFTEWEEQWRAGERPTRWPYGLDLLADYADEVSLVLLPHASKWRRPLRPVTDLVANRRARRVPGRDIGLAWEERTATRMVSMRRHREMYSGAIWVTDDAEGRDADLQRQSIKALREMTGVFVLARAQLDPVARLVDGARDTTGTPTDVSFVKYGIGTDFYTPRPLPAPEQPVVLSVGTDLDRDWDTLVAAFETVRAQVPDARFVVQARAGTTLPEWIESLPHMGQSALREVYAKASVVAVATKPNLHVSGMTVSMEARAMGRPVVATRTAGIEDYLTADVDCAMVEPGDAAGMATHLVRLLRDRDAARVLAEAGRASVDPEMSIPHLVERLASSLHLHRRETPGTLTWVGQV